MLTASEVLSKRWKSVIMWLLGRHSRRFNELHSHMRGVTPKVLTEQLRELERDGLVSRSVVRGGAKHVEYALTTVGERLRPILEQLQEWGRGYIAARDDADEASASECQEREPEGRAVHLADREQARGVVTRADKGAASDAGTPAVRRDWYGGRGEGRRAT